MYTNDFFCLRRRLFAFGLRQYNLTPVSYAKFWEYKINPADCHFQLKACIILAHCDELMLHCPVKTSGA